MTTEDNPFSAARLQSLPFSFSTGNSWETLLARCAENNYRCAIVGPAGSGKTALLTQLTPHLAGRGFTPRLFTLRPDSRRAEKDAIIAEARRLRSPEFLLLDGAEQLHTREWLALRSVIDGISGCVITLHRTGRLPTLIETTTTPVLLEDLAAELTGGRLPMGEAAAVFARARGNLRQCFDELRDRWAGA